jgi:hypothetical protein
MSSPQMTEALREVAAHHVAIADRLTELSQALDQPAPMTEAPDRNSRSGGKSPWISRHFPPDSLRGCAERALVEEDGPLDLELWAERIREMGFNHPWNPRNPRQLEASLTALPHQTPVFVRVGRGIYDLASRHTGS